jgi:hypothetical protein
VVLNVTPTPGSIPALKGSRLTLALLALTVLVLAMATPRALRETLERGEIYVFTARFLADIPKRLAGPGSFRFVLQPTLAGFFGARDGIADARAGRTPYLLSLVLARGRRRELVRSGLGVIANLLLMGILLDALFQKVILGATYPGAALVLGPVLICFPYALARALANRAARAFGRG